MIAITHVPSKQLQRCQLTHLPSESIDHALAVEQHEGYCQMLRDLGVGVISLDVNKDMPDSVFVEDTAIILDELAIMTPMGNEARRAEPAGIEQELKKHREIRHIKLPAMIEGGDVLKVGQRFLIGNSSRTNSEGIEAFRKIVTPFEYDILSVPVHGCLHFKTACTALPDGRLLVNPNWIDMNALSGFESISVPEEEPFAANLLLVGDTVCLASSHQHTAELIRNLGFKVKTTDISELAKAEGAMTCSSLIL